MIKSKFIFNILDLLLDGDNEGIAARKQLEYLSENVFEYTGSGAFVNFNHDKEIENFKVDNHDLILDGLLIETDEFLIEADATLFFINGKIDYLEIWCHYGDYPNSDLTRYTISQNWQNSPGRKITIE